MHSWKKIGTAAVIVIAVATASVQAYAPAKSADVAVTPPAISRVTNILLLSTIRLADGHADACKANYDQCAKACDGATSCTKQCQTNYDNCMKNGS